MATHDVRGGARPPGPGAASTTAPNPVLPGFNPDPNILRVGDDYYLATSTFEWFPGVQIHSSRDLVTWRRLGGALDSVDLLDLRGAPDSGGVWAPQLSFADGSSSTSVWRRRRRRPSSSPG